ncbi:MAG: 5-formyltetrahydrofolate cyclo-ligase, partial [Halobacteriaceae archaeon]
CFLRLDPDDVEDVEHATTISGSAAVGVPVAPEDVERVDLIVSGSVAVTEDGARVGKGEGYSDLEFAILREFGAVDGETTTATTVHELQVTDAAVPAAAHDVPMDLVVTPERTVRTGAGADRPAGVDWTRLPAETREEIPALQSLAE